AQPPSEQHLLAQDLASGARVRVASAPYDFTQATSFVPFHRWLTDGTLAVAMDEAVETFAFESGVFEFKDVGLAPGANQLIARAADAASGLESPDSEIVEGTVPDGAFPDLAVTAAALSTHPPRPRAGPPAALPARH